MKTFPLVLSAAVLLAGCDQKAPVTSTPTATEPVATTPAPEASAAGVPAPDAPTEPAVTVPSAPVKAATSPVAATLREAETLKLAFTFKPMPNASDPSRPKTSAHLLLKGAKPLSIDLGKFATQPDVVDAKKAKLANFPSGMLMGFRSYEPSSGISSDLAVLHVDSRYLRIVQRRVEETAAEPGAFETAREIPLGPNTKIVVEQPAPKPVVKKQPKKLPAPPR